jgi:hypothetical protein
MGGTGKSMAAVAVLQEKAIRAHFSNIYWLVVGADAVDLKFQQLRLLLYKQLSGKSVKADDVLTKDMLVEAMPMERALVVLDDPWTPEQVRFLNPIENSHAVAHRLLVTTRIRGLVPKATCVELSVMGKDEAVALLLDLANIQKEAYRKEHPGVAWPPQEAYAIVSECGLLPITLTIAAQVVRPISRLLPPPPPHLPLSTHPSPHPSCSPPLSHPHSSHTHPSLLRCDRGGAAGRRPCCRC